LIHKKLVGLVHLKIQKTRWKTPQFRWHFSPYSAAASGEHASLISAFSVVPCWVVTPTRKHFPPSHPSSHPHFPLEPRCLFACFACQALVCFLLLLSSFCASFRFQFLSTCSRRRWPLVLDFLILFLHILSCHPNDISAGSCLRREESHHKLHLSFVKVVLCVPRTLLRINFLAYDLSPESGSPAFNLRH